jgi:hypothetical protein
VRHGERPASRYTQFVKANGGIGRLRTCELCANTMADIVLPMRRYRSFSLPNQAGAAGRDGDGGRCSAWFVEPGINFCPAIDLGS